MTGNRANGVRLEESARLPRLVEWLKRPEFWFVLAAVIRLLYLMEQGGSSPLFYQPLLDEKEAIDSALALLHGTVVNEPYFKAPGYSWIVAVIMELSGGAWPWTIRAVQHLAGAWLVGLTASLAGTISPAATRKWSIIAAGALASVYAPMIRLEDNLSLDFWVVFFQSAMIYLLVRGALSQNLSSRAVLGAGILAAAAWITRPTITLAVPFLVGWIFWIGYSKAHRLRTVSNAIIFLAPILIAAACTLVRNEMISREPMLMPWQGGYSFYYANRPEANGRYFLQSQVVMGPEANPTRQLAVAGFRASLPDSVAAEFDRSPNYSDVNRYWFQKAIHSIEAGPLAWTGLMGRKWIYLFSDKEIFNYEDYDLQRQLSPLLGWLPGRFGLVFPLALASIAMVGLLSTRRRKLHALPWIYAMSFGGAVALYYVSGRMRMPLAFPMIVLAGFSVGMFWTLPRKRKFIAVALCIIGVVISWGDWWGVRGESMAYADLARMSNAAWQRTHYDKALDFALESEKLNPDNPLIHRLKGQALYGLGRLEESRGEFQKSVQMLNDESSKKNLKVIEQEIKKRNDSGL